MAAPPVEIPCEPWTDDASVRQCCNGLDPAFDLTDAITFATAILYRLSGRQFPGVCERTVWPCLANCGCCLPGFLGNDWWWYYNSYPAWPVTNTLGTGFVNVGPCNEVCSIDCVDLPATVNEIIEITIDGEILDPSLYAISAYRRVCRMDGGKWPCTNIPGADPGPGVFTITYEYGKPVPADGRIAAAIFACQIALNRCGGESCLPQRLKNITRQDVEMAFADPLEFLEKGQTGIYEVDLWLQSVNPSKLKRRSRLHRADKRGGNFTFSG